MAPSLTHALWDSQIPLHITHPSSPTTPFILSVPRFSYLAVILPRLSAFFGTPCSSFHFEQVQLRNLAVGLLVDLYQPSLPWRLTVTDGVSWDMQDTFLNAAKEADFIRNGSAKQTMKLSREDTNQFWHSILDNNYAAFHGINRRLLNASTALKHVPLRIYIPEAPSSSEDQEAAGSFRVVQSLVAPVDRDTRTAVLLGQALKNLMPALFPSSRDPVLASIVLHGAPVPFNAPLEELMTEAAYPDGWLNLVVRV